MTHLQGGDVSTSHKIVMAAVELVKKTLSSHCKKFSCVHGTTLSTFEQLPVRPKPYLKRVLSIFPLITFSSQLVPSELFLH